MELTVFTILGMRDKQCREILTNILRAVEGVREVTVSPITTRASVWHDPPCTAPALAWAILSLGYGVLLAANGVNGGRGDAPGERA
ncbi:MAG: heavy-metal-associated domain-containing protein [Phycisphaeraceae bacterium]|nr:heavy-metal-associated domain-containing protein [Phycisphaeraceae bacterium]